MDENWKQRRARGRLRRRLRFPLIFVPNVLSSVAPLFILVPRCFIFVPKHLSHVAVLYCRVFSQKPGVPFRSLEAHERTKLHDLTQQAMDEISEEMEWGGGILKVKITPT